MTTQQLLRAVHSQQHPQIRLPSRDQIIPNPNNNTQPHPNLVVFPSSTGTNPSATDLHNISSISSIDLLPPSVDVSRGSLNSSIFLSLDPAAEKAQLKLINKQQRLQRLKLVREREAEIARKNTVRYREQQEKIKKTIENRLKCEFE